jgi:hypothetical protein
MMNGLNNIGLSDTVMRTEDYPRIQSLESRYADKMWNHISQEDFEESILATWKLFHIECKKFLNLPKDIEKGFSIRLIDELAAVLNLNEQTIGQLHLLRKTRNDYEHGNPSSHKQDWELVKIGVNITERMLKQKEQEQEQEGQFNKSKCADCGARWDNYDECDWCGWSPQNKIIGLKEVNISEPKPEPKPEPEIPPKPEPKPEPEILPKPEPKPKYNPDQIFDGTNCLSCGEQWENFDECDWCGWAPRSD